MTVWPEPFGPTCTTVLPTTSRNGLAASKSSGVPPTMIDSAALIAPGSPPETGASMIRRPASFACCASATVTSGRIEEKSTTSAPGFAFARTPSSPVSTASTSGESGTMIATTSAPETASATDSAARPPASTSGAVFSGLRL
ncbi:Uncharacterised protein [Mycobacteroides abscessus]|nr:Uncharacterised protein [Mycobacteroides abscessus]